MPVENNIPHYITDDFSLYLENMVSLTDPENPELLPNYLASLFEQLKKAPLIFNGMVDQLAMAIATKVRVDSKGLTKINLNKEPSWGDIKPFVAVHAEARACITEIMTQAENELKTAILLIHFYSGFDATPLPTENDEDNNFADDFAHRYDINGYDADDFDENY